MPPSSLFTDPYVSFTFDRARRIVRYTRTAVPYPELSAVRESFDQLARVAADLDRGRLAILLDLRAAPPRNDPAFEAEVLGAVSALLNGFRASAFLVKTAVGGLQVRRLANSESSASTQVFTDEAEAVGVLDIDATR